MHKSIIIATMAATGIAAQADIVRVGEFQSLQFEGFENLDMSSFEQAPVEAFGGMATLLNSNNSFLHTTGGWSYKNMTQKYEGSRLLGTTRGGVEYQFNLTQRSFGGFFSSIDNIADGSVRFFNGDTFVGSDDLLASVDGNWTWNGWSSDAEFDRVVIESNALNKGFMMHDSVRVLQTQVPASGSVAILATGAFLCKRRRR
tara:strand:- start:90533 stop:91135 length:603 start_codon:yes stop_codon:yes gene_type:complete